MDLFLKVFFSNLTTENPLDFLCKAALYTNGLQTINVALMAWTFYPQKTPQYLAFYLSMKLARESGIFRCVQHCPQATRYRTDQQHEAFLWLW